ncbi:MAG: response regulator [Gemmatimonadota bacterium]|nr:response regulator [Gemmatimonadota bacterium]
MRHNIALVEDNPDNRLLIHALLDERYDVIEYADGRAALDGLSIVRPDVMLLDISLPEMDGAEVLSRIRRDPAFSGLPVIALTAHAMAGDRARFLDAGFDDYVTKPIADETLLLGAIERCLSIRLVGRRLGS